MTSIIQSIIDGYNDIMIHRRDPRVDGWLFMSGPLPTLCICLTYVWLVKVAGPYLMKNREPFQLRRFIIFYNFFQVLFSTWLFYELMMSGWWRDYSLRCQPIDFSNSPKARRMVNVCWWYYFSKFTEFFDTFFFVARKKYQQISPLHVIHHGVMPMSVWFGVKFTPGGHSTFFGLLNTFVHIIMYFYYMMAAMGPQYQKYLWWKKYLTTLQMVQFVAMMTHSFQLLFIECNYPKEFVWWIGGHAFMFLILFSDFYRKAYRHNKRTAKASSNGEAINGCTQQPVCYTNGDVKKERLNGHAVTNGHVKYMNGATNGYRNGHSNGVSSNGVSSNGVSSNGVSSNGVSSNGVSSNGISSNGVPNGHSKHD